MNLIDGSASFDKEAFRKHLAEKWGAIDCPMCRLNQWTISDYIFQMSTYSAGNVIVGEPVFPVIPVVCLNCGYVANVSPLVGGVLQPPTKPSASAALLAHQESKP